MTDITKLAQRARINAECGEHLSPAETMELVEALESEKRICATWRKTAESTGEKLEKAQQVDEELCKLLPPGAEYMDPPDGGDVTPLEGVRRMVADYRQRIADLESRTVSVKLPDDAEHDIMAPVAAYLSEKFKWDGSAALWDGRKEYDVLADRVKYALRMVIRRAAGIKVEAE